MKFSKIVFHGLLGMLLVGLWSCRQIPEGATAVKPFDKQRYLGKWYEIARLDNRFERGLTQVTAEYSLNEDGSIRVQNRGYRTEKKKWSEAIGKAKFAGDENVAMLRVSFFGPFYAGYNVIALDKDYRYALVAGDSHAYLWILSREKSIPADIKDAYLTTARNAGYDTAKLLWVKQ